MLDPLVERVILHDMANSLSGITAGAGLFLDGLLGSLTKDQTEILENINLSAILLTSIIADLRDIVFFEEGRTKIEKTTYTIGQIYHSLSWIEKYAQKVQKSLKTQFDPTFEIKADPEMLKRILLNLLLNSIKQSRTGNIVLFKVGIEIDNILFEIIDQSEPLPGPLHEKAFDKNFRVDYPEMRSRAGIGLGFYFCRLAVEAHGGKIGIEERKKGEGMRYFFTLPK
ncbi:MAG: ATP-binding protein [Patescibacteria group bacterium]